MFQRYGWVITATILILCQGCASTAISKDKYQVYNGFITTGGDTTKFEFVPTKTVSQKDEVYVVEHIKWDPNLGSQGVHPVRWQWYSGDKLVAVRSEQKKFDKTPDEFWYRLPGGDFKSGHYRVDVSIDGTIVDSQEFDVVK
jgi:hypothetical protein